MKTRFSHSNFGQGPDGSFDLGKSRTSKFSRVSEINQYYQILELEPGASLKEVKQAYRDLAFVWHPDRFSHNPRLQAKAGDRFKQIDEAYRQLRSILKENPQGLRADSTRPSQPATTQGRRQSAPKSPPGYGSERSHKVGQVHRQSTSKSSFTENSIPWGWLIGTFLCYAVTGWVLVVADVPSWSWALVQGVACLGLTVLTIDGGGSQRSWAIALLVGCAVAGWIAGQDVGGVATAAAWSLVGCLLVAIAAMEPGVKPAVVVVTLAGAIAMAGFIAGFGALNILEVIISSIIWASAGFVFGTIVDVLVSSKTPNGICSVIGFWIGGWSGAWNAAWKVTKSKHVAIAMANAAPNLIFAAWGVIAIVSAIVAQMLAGDKLIELWNGFYTFLILAAISGFGLWFGSWLANFIVS